jgi:hypothetical protein
MVANLYQGTLEIIGLYNYLEYVPFSSTLMTTYCNVWFDQSHLCGWFMGWLFEDDMNLINSDSLEYLYT